MSSQHCFFERFYFSIQQNDAKFGFSLKVGFSFVYILGDKQGEDSKSENGKVAVTRVASNGHLQSPLHRPLH